MYHHNPQHPPPSPPKKSQERTTVTEMWQYIEETLLPGALLLTEDVNITEARRASRTRTAMQGNASSDDGTWLITPVRFRQLRTAPVIDENGRRSKRLEAIEFARVILHALVGGLDSS